VQTDLLEKSPKANVRVFAVWFRMYPGDARETWRPEVMPDPRVRHFWDDGRLLGREYYKALPRLAPRRSPQTRELQGDVQWDAYYLYRPGVAWEKGYTDVVSWGRTVLATQDTLRADLAKVLTAAPK
jgi:hypothetical protein